MKFTIIHIVLAMITVIYNVQAKTKRPGILLRGWFKYMPIVASAPSQEFRVNPEYMKELRTISGEEANATDGVGALTIPDEKSFYMILTSSTLNVLTSRRNQITKTFDVIDLAVKDIYEAPSEDGSVTYKGGVQGLGQFDEGYCLKINLRSGKAYIVCNAKEKLINQMMGYVYRMWLSKKEGEPHEFDKEVEKDTNFMIDNQNFDMAAYIKNELEGKDNPQPFDLGDWSVCDKVCDGGTQEKNVSGCGKPIGGYKCDKPPKKVVRKCNTNPCEGQAAANPEAGGSPPGYRFKEPFITLPLSLESHFVSHRYQQYEECKIKDEDLCIRRADLVPKLGIKGTGPPILPGRAVLNAHTFSFYENTKYDSLHRSYALDTIEVKRFAFDSDCFEVQSRYDAMDTLVLCGCPFEPNVKDAPGNWIKEILKFRDNCPNHYGNAVHVLGSQSVNLKYGNETINVSGEKLQKLARNTMESNERKKEREDEEAEAAKVADALNQVQTLTTSMSKNEFFRAKEMQKEEEKRQAKELADIDRLVQKEREKEKCIQTFMEREQMRMARKQREESAENELQEIKKEVEEQVKDVKKVFSKKLYNMRKDFERKKMEKMKELTDYKLRITSMLVDSGSKGSAANCKQDKKEVQEAYCNARFPYSWFENKHCRTLENFCGVCCGKEFGVKFADESEKCIYECKLLNGLIEKPPSAGAATPETATVEIINNP